MAPARYEDVPCTQAKAVWPGRAHVRTTHMLSTFWISSREAAQQLHVELEAGGFTVETTSSLRVA